MSGFAGRVESREHRLRRSSTLVAFLAFAAAGCLAPRLDPEAALHVVMADSSGGPADPATQRSLSPSAYDAHLRSVLDGAEDYFEARAREGETKRLLIFVHGGLNSPGATIRRANERSHEVLVDGSYPIFLGWHSSLVSSYAEHLVEARRGRTWQTGGVLSAPLYLVADLGRSVTRAPIVWLHELSSTLESFSGTAWKPGLFVTTRNTGAHFELLQEQMKASPSIRISQGEDDGPRSWQVAGAVRTGTYLLTLPFKLAAAPIIDGFGKQAWKMMERRTELLRRRQPEFELDVERLEDGTLDAVAPSGSRTGAFAVFADRLVAFRNAHPEVEVTLVGHSMGAIIANWLVADYGAALLPRNIVYMAAAASVRDIERDVLPYLEGHDEARFFQLTLHPRAEVRETWSAGMASFGLDPAPRGSLLVWIDNYFADPTAFSDRTAGRWDNVVPAAHIVPRGLRDRVFIKAFGVSRWGGSDPANPQIHGDFGKAVFWDEAFWMPEKGRSR